MRKKFQDCLLPKLELTIFGISVNFQFLGRLELSAERVGGENKIFFQQKKLFFPKKS